MTAVTGDVRLTDNNGQLDMQINLDGQHGQQWNNAMNGAQGHHHHHCDGQNGSGNGQQSLSSEIDQLKNEIQDLENQLSSLQGSSQGNSSSDGNSAAGLMQMASMFMGFL